MIVCHARAKKTKIKTRSLPPSLLSLQCSSCYFVYLLLFVRQKSSSSRMDYGPARRTFSVPLFCFFIVLFFFVVFSRLGLPFVRRRVIKMRQRKSFKMFSLYSYISRARIYLNCLLWFRLVARLPVRSKGARGLA